MKYLYCEIKTDNLAPFEEGLDYSFYEIKSIIVTGKDGFEVKSEDILQLAFAVWVVKIYFVNEQKLEDFKKVITDLANNLMMEVLVAKVMEDEKDYILESQKEEVIQVNHFLIYNQKESYDSHYDSNLPAYEVKKNMYPIFIDHGTAFGTGKHETTALCLQFINDMALNNYMPRGALDLGTGSGILAIAMAKCFGSEVLATDMDSLAITKAEELIRLNGVDKLVSTLLSDGFKQIDSNQKFSLITANILLNPLIAMKQDFHRSLDDNGFIIVSGVLTNQVDGLVKEYEETGFTLEAIKKLNNWAALIFRKLPSLKI